MNLSKIILAGVAFAAVSQLIHSLGATLTMGFYFDPAYFPVWSKVMMPGPGPPPASFYYYSIAFGLVNGIVLAFAFAIIRGGIPGRGLKKGLLFGLLVFLIASLPSSLSLYLLINLPVALIIYWTVEGFVACLIGGAIIGLLVK